MSVDFFTATANMFNELAGAIGIGSFIPGGGFIIGSIGEILLAAGSIEAPAPVGV